MSDFPWAALAVLPLAFATLIVCIRFMYLWFKR